MKECTREARGKKHIFDIYIYNLYYESGSSCYAQRKISSDSVKRKPIQKMHFNGAVKKKCN